MDGNYEVPSLRRVRQTKSEIKSRSEADVDNKVDNGCWQWSKTHVYTKMLELAPNSRYSDKMSNHQ